MNKRAVHHRILACLERFPLCPIRRIQATCKMSSPSMVLYYLRRMEVEGLVAQSPASGKWLTKEQMATTPSLARLSHAQETATDIRALRRKIGRLYKKAAAVNHQLEVITNQLGKLIS